MAIQKPKNQININTISEEIDICIDNFLNEMHIENDYKSLVNIKHSTVNYMFSYIYEHLFKPHKKYMNNERSLIDYNDIELLQVLADKYINICQRFNKSLGLMSFSYMIGVRYNTMWTWLQDSSESNRARLDILKNIQETHKAQQIAILNDSPVGALAVANNDVETGLQWGEKQAAAAAANTVFILPSERLKTLGIKADAVPGIPST